MSLFLDFPDIEAQHSDADLLEESFAMLAHGIFQIVEFDKPQNKLQRTLVEVFGIHTPSPVLFSFMMFMDVYGANGALNCTWHRRNFPPKLRGCWIWDMASPKKMQKRLSLSLCYVGFYWTILGVTRIWYQSASLWRDCVNYNQAWLALASFYPLYVW